MKKDTNPTTTAIVLIDNKVVENINDLLKGARAKGMKIFRVPLMFSPSYSEMGEEPYGVFKIIKDAGAFQRGSWGGKVADNVNKDPSDIIIENKHTTCAFASTDLEVQLKQHDIKTIALGGLLTNICIETKMRTAYDKNYGVIALTDRSATLGHNPHDASIGHTWPMFSVPITHEQFLENVAPAST